MPGSGRIQTGMTTKFCVVGSPISHSLSPALHSAAYSHLGLNFSYDAHEVAAGDLEKFLEQSNFQGVSVTMPLKAEAFELAVARDAEATLTGVANTLIRTPKGWSASNTDVYGLTQALGRVPLPKRTAIVGAGATAFSALAAVKRLFPETKLTIMARDEHSRNQSVEFGRSVGLDVSGVSVSALELSNSDLVLSLVPAGSFEDAWSEFSSLTGEQNGWLFDAVYNPWPSVPAAAWGNDRVISGLEMLIWQAIEQVSIFTSGDGDESEIDRPKLYSVMKAAVSSK